MVTKKIKKLVQYYLDGELSGRDLLFIEELLKSNEEVRKYLDEMKSLNELLLEDARKEHTVSMKEQVMNAIVRKPSKKIQSTAKPAFFEIVFGNYKWNLAYVFVAGLIIGFFIFSPVFKSSLKNQLQHEDIQGNLYQPENKALFSIPFHSDDLKINISGQELEKNFINISSEISSLSEVHVRISFDPSSFQVWSVKAISQHQNSRILSNMDAVDILSEGDNKFMLLLKKNNSLAQNIKVDVYRDDTLLYTEKITLQ